MKPTTVTVVLTRQECEDFIRPPDFTRTWASSEWLSRIKPSSRRAETRAKLIAALERPECPNCGGDPTQDVQTGEDPCWCGVTLVSK